MEKLKTLLTASIIATVVIISVAIIFIFTKKLAVPFDMLEIQDPVFPNNICNVSDYGAESDSKSSNTDAFSRAIRDCKEKGGGKVSVPPGSWLTGPIKLESGINLEIQKGAVINFTTNLDEYLPPVFTRFEGVEFYSFSPFIYAENANNVAITGEGEIRGQGDFWEEYKEDKKEENDNRAENSDLPNLDPYELAQMGIPVEERVFQDKNDPIQPSFIQFTNCKNILIEKIRVIDGPNWTIHPIYVENMIIRNVYIETVEKNTDGIVIDSSKNVLVHNSQLKTGDDAIVVKSGKDRDGLRVNRPSENIVIHDIQIDGGHAALAIGSEMSGGVKNVYIYNIKINYVDFGIRLKSMPGRGGVVEKIWFKNINISRATQDAIQITLNYGTPVDGYDKNNPPVFRDVTIENLTCRRTRNSIRLIGLPESLLERVTLKNIKINATKKPYLENTKDEKFKNLKVEIRK